MTDNLLAILENPIYDPTSIIKTTELSEIEEIPIEDNEPEEIQEYKPRDYQERSYEDILCSTLDDMGVQYERQKKVENGIIDVFIYGQPPTIIEIKRAATPYLLIQAAVQLKFYAGCFKKCRLYVSTPKLIDEKHRDILHKMRIGEARRCWVPNQGDPEGIAYDPRVHKVVVEYLD